MILDASPKKNPTLLSTEIKFLHRVFVEKKVRSAGSSELKIFSLASGRLYVSFWWDFEGVGVGGRFRRFLAGDRLVMVDGWWTEVVGTRDAREDWRLSSDPPCITLKYIHPEIILKWKVSCFFSADEGWFLIMRISCLAIQCPFAMKQNMKLFFG